MGNLRVVVVGMVLGQQADQAKPAVAEQVASKRWGPAGVALIKTPGELGKDLDTWVPQGNLFDLQGRLRNLRPPANMSAAPLYQTPQSPIYIPLRSKALG